MSGNFNQELLWAQKKILKEKSGMQIYFLSNIIRLKLSFCTAFVILKTTYGTT